MNSGIYKITYLPTGQKYIGQAINIEERWGYHRTRKTNNPMDKLLQDESTDIRDFRFDILETNNDNYSIDWADKKEIYWIKKENSYYYDNPQYGCNLTRGGSKGWKQMSRVKTKGVEQLDLNNNIIAQFKSRADAERMTGIAAQSISKVISKKRKTAGGYFWRDIGSTEIYLNDTIPHNFKGKMKIDVYDANTLQLIKICDNASSAAREFNVDSGDIRRCCVGERIIVKGYIFRYNGDDLYKFKIK